MGGGQEKPFWPCLINIPSLTFKAHLFWSVLMSELFHTGTVPVWTMVRLRAAATLGLTEI